ncbi:MAG: hypothetical protein AUJ97_07795 [Bacteroidetes bacterium CG2_30_32_10]|nr:MAG: hypothetical protein AUJ97_07795 [Bacteroidetes bacterium CG2_30_32_10]
MGIEIREVNCKSELRKFIHLPAKIHKNHPNWVPPIYADEWIYYNPKKNKSFSYSDTSIALAYKDNEIVGRIFCIINHRYNESHHEKNGRFTNLECYNDQEVAHALLTYAENWAKAKGMDKIVGCLGFSDKDPQGLLIEGFDAPIIIATNGNLPYVPKLIENEGYVKDVDSVDYQIVIPEIVPEFYAKIYERAMLNNDIVIHEFTKRNDLKQYIRPIFNLINEAYAHIYAFAPFEEKEMDDFANRFLFLIDPAFIKLITNKEGKLMSFIIGMPDISDGIRKSKGYLFPFGLLHIMRSAKKTKMLNLLLGAIQDDYRNCGLDVIMGIKMLESCKKAGIKYIDSHLILETNSKMRAEIERMSGKIYKRYRVFQKKL